MHFLFSPNETFLAFSEDNSVVVYDMTQRKRQFQVLGVRVETATFSLDGQSLIIGGGEPPCIQWWTLEGKLMHSFYLHSAPSAFHFLGEAALHVLTKTAHGDEYVDLALFLAKPNPPPSWESLTLPSYTSVLTDSAAQNNARDYFSVHAVCQAQQEKLLHVTCELPSNLFQPFYRFKTFDDQNLSHMQYTQMLPIIEPIYETAKATAQEKKETGLEEIEALVEEGKKQIQSLQIPGMMEWEQGYQ